MEDNVPPQVVILAAGMGTRLSPISDGRSKALVRVGGKTLLDLALDFATELSPGGERIVVGGYRFDLLEEHHKETGSSSYTLINNINYKAGSIFSLLRALQLVTGNFYLLNADHIFPRDSARLFSRNRGPNVSIFCDRDRILGDDDMKVELSNDRQGHVKQISKTLTAYNYGYIGVTYVSGSALPKYAKAAGDVLSEFDENASVERVIQLLANRGEAVVCHLIDGISWYEVDTPDDYDRAVRYAGSL